jgi:hypothetical protein
VATTQSQRAAEAPSDVKRAACDVTIVANDIGPLRGMERQLTELITGLRRAWARGHRDRSHM